jgi:hypothetical protein
MDRTGHASYVLIPYIDPDSDAAEVWLVDQDAAPDAGAQARAALMAVAGTDGPAAAAACLETYRVDRVLLPLSADPPRWRRVWALPALEEGVAHDVY